MGAIDKLTEELERRKKEAAIALKRQLRWNDYVSHIKPILEANPDWNVGDAEDYLRREGVDLGPLFGVNEDELTH